MADAPVLHLAAFGKHPGWDDHLDDQGMESAWLVALKRKLYFEGVGANLDASTWERLPPEHRLAGFDHEFLWRAHGGLAMGRLSPSRDGKGRDRYPFVLCVHTERVPLVWLLHRARGQVEELDRQCRAESTADAVIRHLDLIRGRLRRNLDLARSEGDDYSAWFQEASGFSTLLRHASLGPEQVGLHRILYKLHRDASAWLPGTRGGTAPECLHLRVPAVCDTPAGALLFWYSILLRLLRPEVPVLVIRPAQGGWVDLLAGVPSASQFTCLCANAVAMPPVSEVPYQIDDAAAGWIAGRVSLLAADGGAMQDALPDTAASAGPLASAIPERKGLWGGLKSLWGTS